MLTIQQLIIRYEEAKKEIINPNNFTSWEDFGFDEPPGEKQQPKCQTTS